MLQPRSIQSSLGIRDKILSLDIILIISILVLGVTSMFAMYSTDGGEFKYHTNSHILRFFVFFGMFFVVSFISIRFWHETSYLVYIGIFILLLGVKYFGLTSSGSKRWLDLYFMNLQPSELMKIGLILFLAKYYHRISIEGVNSLNQIEYSIMPDRIMAGTFCIAACLNQGDLEIENINSKIITTELNLLKRVGARIRCVENKIYIKGPKKIKSVQNIKTKEYPGVATDLQSQLMVLMCKANGKSSITENIFENRFMHVAELRRLGAKIDIKNNKATIQGVKKLVAAPLMSSDLRASISLVLAGMSAEGESRVDRIYHLDRGAENFEKKLKKIGVDIKRLK